MPGEGGGRALAAAGAVLTLAYPVTVYVGLSRVSPRALGVSLATLLGAGVLLRLRGARREHALVAARIPLTVMALLLAGALLDDRRFVLALPALTNGALLAHFATSLRTMPIAERFARAQEPHLSPERVAYCRAITVMWCAFFVANGAVCAALALAGPLALWTLYTGAISYVLIALVASLEYVVRKARFRRFGDTVVDRALSRLFPPAEPGPAGVRK
jgi:uncharacterized membrane protein